MDTLVVFVEQLDQGSSKVVSEMPENASSGSSLNPGYEQRASSAAATSR